MSITSMEKTEHFLCVSSYLAEHTLFGVLLDWVAHLTGSNLVLFSVFQRS